MRAIERGASPEVARASVASLALERPDWDMSERRSMLLWAVEEGPTPEGPGGE